VLCHLQKKTQTEGAWGRTVKEGTWSK